MSGSWIVCSSEISVQVPCAICEQRQDCVVSAGVAEVRIQCCSQGCEQFCTSAYGALL